MSTYNYENQNSKSFYNLAWIAFVASFIGMAVGLIYLNADLPMKGFLAMSYLFSLTACFMISKVVRDKHETEQALVKADTQKNDRFLSDGIAL